AQPHGGIAALQGGHRSAERGAGGADRAVLHRGHSRRPAQGAHAAAPAPHPRHLCAAGQSGRPGRDGPGRRPPGGVAECGRPGAWGDRALAAGGPALNAAVAAFFDVDGTLTRTTVLGPLLWYQRAHLPRWRFRVWALGLALQAPGYWLLD